MDASSVGFRNLTRVWSKTFKKTKRRRSGVSLYTKATKNLKRRNLKFRLLPSKISLYAILD